MAKQKKRVWNSLRYYDNETMLEEGAFKAMLEDGWICTHMAWSQTNVEDSDKYPENLIRELEKKDPYHDWPETISEEHLKGLTFVLALLDDKTQDILSLRYQKGLTLEAIGSIYELTRERVRQIIQMALSDIVEDYEKSKIISLGLDSYINRETVRRYNLEETYCSSCGREIAKRKCKEIYETKEQYRKRSERVSLADKINITIHCSDLDSFENLLGELSLGESISASISNITPEVLSLKIEDFYIVENGKRIAPGARLHNVHFYETFLIPGETRDTGVVWETEDFQDYLSYRYNSKIVIALKLSDEQGTRVYTYAWDRVTSSFELEDFMIVTQA